MRHELFHQAVPQGGTSHDNRPTAAQRLVGGVVAFAAGLVLSCLPALAAPAGTIVSNTARLNYEVEGEQRTILSNTVDLILAERLDVTAEVDDSNAPVVGEDGRAIAFVVTNTGNGAESFALTTVVKENGPSVLAVALDTDGNGTYDPQIDRPVANGQLSLEAGKSARVFVIVDTIKRLTSVSLTATATTGSGNPGTVFDKRGDNGGDAVVGDTGATATATIDGNRLLRLLMRFVLTDPSLVKSQSVLAPDGSTRAVKDAIITYRLDAHFLRTTDAVDIADAIPEGTVYVPGSLTLDGESLSDAVDADAGRFTDNAIAVDLGDVDPGTRTIIFQVRIL